MIRLYGFPYSTNMERVQMAIAHKGLEAEYVGVPVDDRSTIREISGQSLVPVIDHDGEIVCDSPVIVRHLDERFPEPPLYPDDRARHAEVELFIDWFNRVWKVPPNAIEAELGKESPDQARILAWSAEMLAHLDVFTALLDGRDYLMGEFSAADIIAHPFLRFAAFPRSEDDPHLFHTVLVDNMPLSDRHAPLREWIHRVEQFPMSPALS